jgi:hypothetical protein
LADNFQNFLHRTGMRRMEFHQERGFGGQVKPIIF